MRTRIFHNGITSEDWVDVPAGYKRLPKGKLKLNDKILDTLAFCEKGLVDWCKVDIEEGLDASEFVAIRKSK